MTRQSEVLLDRTTNMDGVRIADALMAIFRAD
jgi:hypothetical protein